MGRAFNALVANAHVHVRVLSAGAARDGVSQFHGRRPISWLSRLITGRLLLTSKFRLSLVIALVHSVELAISSAVLASVISHERRGRTGARQDQIPRADRRNVAQPATDTALVLGIAFLQYVAWINQKIGLDLRGAFLALLVAHTTVAIPFVLTIVLARLSSFDWRRA